MKLSTTFSRQKQTFLLTGSGGGGAVVV